ncbi:unnamed protein product [Arctia plantaginis]|uniref:Uncharacterized protein n=1 Tax=Arctia plantaginis TaxID=874455 RepID=A0A8S0ZW25_ARCPL|nr:unnamed protein product [Arctia plantaginis]
METYVRGFSYMPTNKVELVDMQDALERTWRNTRRERLKQREQKIWEEFVKEKDIVNTVCEDDQYQFLDQLPDSCVLQIMETELTKLKQAKQVDPEPQEQEESVQEEQTAVHSLEDEKDDCDMFHIFDDEKIEQSRTGKSSENFTNVIESSIYCAKVKDLRLKITDELLDMVSVLDSRQIFSMEKEDITRMIKRSAEFCSRFNRIYLYQLQRQVFRKSMEQTCCVRESVSALGALLGAARCATDLCAALRHPRDLTAAQQLYDDSVSALGALLGAARCATDLCAALRHPRDLTAAQQLYDDVFRKSMEQTCCVRESVSALGALLGAARCATDLCAALRHPRDLTAAQQLYDDVFRKSMEQTHRRATALRRRECCICRCSVSRWSRRTAAQQLYDDVFRKSMEQTCCVRESVSALGALLGAARCATDLCGALRHPRDRTAAQQLYDDVFRKSMEQTCCVRESVSALGALLGAARCATDLCAALRHPRDLTAAQQLYDDSVSALGALLGAARCATDLCAALRHPRDLTAAQQLYDDVGVVSVFRKSMEQTCCVRESVSALGALLGAARCATDLCAALRHPRDLTAAQQLYDDVFRKSMEQTHRRATALRRRECCICRCSVSRWSRRTAAQQLYDDVFRKSMEQTHRRATALRRRECCICRCSVSRWSRRTAAQQLYDDNLLTSCDKLEQFVNEYAVRCEEFLMGYANIMSGRSKKSKESKKTKKRPLLSMRKSSNNSEADSRLSMYSLGTVRLNTKPSSSKDVPCRSRRPLMRDPHAGAPRAPRAPRAAQRALRDDIPTMVEGVLACASTHMLTDDSSPKAPPRRTKGINKDEISRKSLPNTPRRNKAINPKPATLIKGLIQTVNQEANLTKQYSPTTKTRTNHKNLNKEEKKKEEDNKKEVEENVDVEDNSVCVESPKVDSETCDSTKSRPQTLDPIKSVVVKPAAVKLETAVHSEAPQVQPLDLGLIKPETNVESPKREALQSPQATKPHKMNGVEERKEKSKKSYDVERQTTSERLLVKSNSALIPRFLLHITVPFDEITPIYCRKARPKI